MRKIVQVVEIDIDQCTRTWGDSPCLASFVDGVVRKCYNTFGTCAYTEAYNKGVNTLRFIEASYPVKGANYFPVLVGVGGTEQQVNIAGYTSNIGGLGIRANINITLRDFPYRDTLTDKYWDERISGAAQTNELGYDPLERGSFWTKFLARNPNYAGRPIRVIQAHFEDDGSIVYDKVRSYVMDELKGPDGSGNVTIRAKDVLSLADDKKALAPVTSRGRVLEDMTIDQTSLVLSPAGIGDEEYPASGVITIGAEVMTFTRSGDTLTLVRGQRGTEAKAHKADDTVQLAYDVSLKRADEVIYDLLVNYGNVPASYIDFAEWQAEFNIWGENMLLSATICKPNGVSKLIAEINLLGIAIWWDEVAMKIRLQLNHPPQDTPVTWTDQNNIMKISTEDNDDRRATRIEIWTVQIDPTKELSKDNFLRGDINISVDSEAPEMFGLPRTQQIFCRWLNHGANALVKIQSGRLLNRYKRAPVTYSVKIDAKDDVSLAQVVAIKSHVTTDVTGKEKTTLTQVFSRKDDKNGSTVDVQLQMFQFDQRYGKIAPNDYPVYNNATEEQKYHGSFFVGPSLVFADGSAAYSFI